MDRLSPKGGSQAKGALGVWPRIAGGVTGALVGGVHLGAAGLVLGLLLLSTVLQNASFEAAIAALVLSPILGTMVGATGGAALGATLMQRYVKQRCSFWRTMLVATAGMVIGVPSGTMVGIAAQVPLAEILVGVPLAVTMIVAGAVIGSGWKAGPAPTPVKPSEEPPEGSHRH